jgi:hypothetical protein
VCRCPAGAIPGWAPAHTVVIFIIGRLIGTIFLLIAVSMITFAIKRLFVPVAPSMAPIR